MITLPLNSFHTIQGIALVLSLQLTFFLVDKFSILQEKPIRKTDSFAMDEIRDLPIEVVNEFLYSTKRTPSNKVKVS
jgi:hypothetical protein